MLASGQYQSLKNFKDNTNEVDTSEIENVKSNIVFTNNDHDISECTADKSRTTPIDENNCRQTENLMVLMRLKSLETKFICRRWLRKQ